MFRRKLVALDYFNSEQFNYADENDFKTLVLWLEDQKIRLYTIEDRQALRETSASGWDDALQKYLADLHCPSPLSDRAALIDWLLGCAVRMEYGDSAEKYQVNAVKGSTGSTSNPLDKLDYNSAEFKSGVASLAQLLQIPPHPDHLQVLKAVCIVVQQRLSQDMIQRHSSTNKAAQPSVVNIPLEKVDLGFETSDYISTEAAKIMRLLHIRDLRDLQNGINEAIVKVQALTANPKTDTKLGKVGF